jgi:hypothetical protein
MGRLSNLSRLIAERAMRVAGRAFPCSRVANRPAPAGQSETMSGETSGKAMRCIPLNYAGDGALWRPISRPAAPLRMPRPWPRTSPRAQSSCTTAPAAKSRSTRSNGPGFCAVSSLARRPAPYPADRDRQTVRPLRDRAIAGFATSVGLRALPASRTQRHFLIQTAAPSATARVRRPSASAACFPAGPAAPQSAAATPRRAYGIPHEPWRAR